MIRAPLQLDLFSIPSHSHAQAQSAAAAANQSGRDNDDPPQTCDWGECNEAPAYSLATGDELFCRLHIKWMIGG